jgi:hypothetical protein
MTRKINRDDIRKSLGELEDPVVVALLATGATHEEFEEAVAWARGESDVVGEMERPLSGAVAAVYDILTNIEGWPEEEV